MLILAATPIGNLGDASDRLRKTLESANHIAAEDTRTLKKLAQGLGISLSANLISLHEHNELQKLEFLVDLAKNEDLILVSDAGMPTISDPGFALVRSAAAAGVEIQIVPGPSAVLSALALSGLATDRFSFEGFLPRKSSDRKRLFKSLANESRTMIFFESPHRIQATLDDAIEILGLERQAAISRELTKKFEETKRGTLQELRDWANDLRGEMVLVIAGAEPEVVDQELPITLVVALLEAGIGLKQATQVVAKATGASASELYSLALKRK
ncbi:MAG: 16S rRNA (cytidine(1402)-2'-O)-methyltransferase [Actinomycetota bacterium]